MAGVAVEPPVSMMDYSWNEDNIDIDFVTVEDLRKLIAKSGGKLRSRIYSKSVTMVATLDEEESPVGSHEEEEQHPPPLTLSVGSWQIREEDLPLYLGVAAGVVLLILLVLAVTTWRCINSGTGAGALRRQRSNTKKENDQSSVMTRTATLPGDGEDSRRDDSRPPPPGPDFCQDSLDLREGLRDIQASLANAAKLRQLAEQAAAKAKAKRLSRNSMVCLNGANKVESKLVVANEQDVQKEGEAEERRARSSHDQSTQKSPPITSPSTERLLTLTPPSYVRVPPIDDNFATTFQTFLPKENNNHHTDIPVSSLLATTTEDSNVAHRSPTSLDEMGTAEEAETAQNSFFFTMPNCSSSNRTRVEEQLYAKVDYSNKVKNRGQDVAVVSPLPVLRETSISSSSSPVKECWKHPQQSPVAAPVFRHIPTSL